MRNAKASARGQRSGFWRSLRRRRAGRIALPQLPEKLLLGQPLALAAQQPLLRVFGLGRRLTRRVNELLERVGVPHLLDVPVDGLSGGQLQRVLLALALDPKPELLLLDEPAAGVPSSDTPRIEQALERLPPSLAVLMIEHDMDLVFRFARRVVVLAAGEIIFEGLPSEVAANEKVREAYLGNYAHARRIA